MTMIDAHQHYWHPKRGDYGWMPKDNPVLNRPYLPKDLMKELEVAGVTHTVLVQAAPSLEETEYMLGIADTTPHVAGVVGWVNFENPADRQHLERLSQHPAFMGVRPMIQDIADPDWMLKTEHDWAYRALCDLGLRFDALGFPGHLENFASLRARHPDLPMVIDHGMKPKIAEHSKESFDHWAKGMSRLAEMPGVYCKLSGLVTEAGEDWHIEDLRPYADHILDAFGAERVMWGSDWPVCRLRAEYNDWLSTAQQLTSALGPDQKKEVFGGAAARFYGLLDETK